MRDIAVAEDRGVQLRVPRRLGPVFPRFSGRDISEECLARLMEVTDLAPSNWNLQPWRWIVVRGAAAKQYLETAACTRAPLTSAPLILICLADTQAWKSAPQYLQEMIASRKISFEEGCEILRQVREYYSSSPEAAQRTAQANAFLAAHQLLLRAAEFDLTAYWVTEFDESKVRTYFHIPDHFLVATLLPIGYSASESAPEAARISLRASIYREKFGEVFGSTSSRG
jgi:nitroreductase